MAISLIAATGSSGGNSGSFTASLGPLTGNNCLIVVLATVRDIGSSPTYSAKWDGVAMTLQKDEFVAMSGFGKGSATIWTKTVGNLSSVTKNAELTVSGGDSSTQWFFTVICFANVDQSSPIQSTAGSSLASSGSGSSLTVPAGGEAGVDVCSLPSTTGPTITGTGHTPVTAVNNSGSGRDASSHATGYVVNPNKTCSWSFTNSYAHALCCFNEAVTPAPSITTVDGDDAVLSTQTNMSIVGTNFAPGGTTKLFYADTSTYATATKVDQGIASVTNTSITWTALTFGSLTGAATRYLFVVTDYGGGSEQVSTAKAITVTVPPAPSITSISGGSTVDTTDTSKTVSGTNFISVGTTKLFLANGTNFTTATKVDQSISSVGPTTLVWDAVSMGALSVGSLYLFVVSDYGGSNQTVSAAFAVTITTPTTPVILYTLGRVSFYANETNITVSGTDFNPGGTTQLWWADSPSFVGATKVAQTISSITSNNFNWNSFSLGAVGEGNFYIFVVTWAGTVKERVSVGFPLRIASAVTPTIVSVDGSATISSTATNMIVYGTSFSQPGTTQLWFANGTNFATATKQVQTIGSVASGTIAWPDIIEGSVGLTTVYLFVRTDSGGANERVSAAFALTVLEPDMGDFVTFLGDDDGGIFVVVRDPDVVEPPASTLLIRDHMAWTGLGTWYYARDIFRDPPESSEIVISGSHTGPLTGGKAIRCDQLQLGGGTRMHNNEQLGMMTEAGRYHFTIGMWVGVADCPSRLTSISLFRIATAGETAWIDVGLVRGPGGAFRAYGSYYNGTTTTTFENTVEFSALTLIGGYAFIVWKFRWDSSTDRIWIDFHGNVQSTTAAAVPYSGIVDIGYLFRTSVMTSGSDPMVRVAHMFYGFLQITSGQVTTLRTSGTIDAFFTNLRAVFGTNGPIHYYKTNDIVPDRFLHNHSGTKERGTAVGGTLQRGIYVGTWGGFAMYCKRFLGGCQGVCEVGASFTTWGTTQLVHARYVGSAAATGNLLALTSPTGATIAVEKTSAGTGPTELSGRLRVLVKQPGGATVLDNTVALPPVNPFDGLFHTYVLSTGTSLSNWKLTVDGYLVWSTSLGSVPAITGGVLDFDSFKIAGADFDCHSAGFKNAYDAGAHTSWHVWSSVYDLLAFMQTNAYNGAYWLQNVRAND